MIFTVGLTHKRDEDFFRILPSAGVQRFVDVRLNDDACFLCSEATADQCHRRLVPEYLQQHWRDLSVVHL